MFIGSIPYWNGSAHESVPVLERVFQIKRGCFYFRKSQQQLDEVKVLFERIICKLMGIKTVSTWKLRDFNYSNQVKKIYI